MSTHRFTITFLLLTALCVSCGKQNEQAKPEASTPLFEDLGAYHRTVTANEQAQKYFDQGLRFIYGFNHDEAERAFREAARLDPNCAMAWWGVAYALGPNYNLPMAPEQNAQALEAVHKAQSLRSAASDVERAYITGIAARYAA